MEDKSHRKPKILNSFSALSDEILLNRDKSEPEEVSDSPIEEKEGAIVVSRGIDSPTDGRGKGKDAQDQVQSVVPDPEARVKDKSEKAIEIHFGRKQKALEDYRVGVAQSLDRRERDLDQRERDLDRREREIHTREEDLVDREGEIQARLKSLEEAERHTADEERKNMEQSEALDSLFEQLENRERVLRLDQDLLGKHREELCAEREAFEEKRSEYADEFERTDRFLEQIRKKEADCKSLEGKVGSLKSELVMTRKEAKSATNAALREQNFAKRAGEEAEKAREIAARLRDEAFWKNYPALMKWLVALPNRKREGLRFDLPSEATVFGESPYTGDDIADILYQLGCKAWDEGCELIIVGRNNWTPALVDQLLGKHEFPSIKIVSQEMLILSVLTGVDMMMAPARVLKVFSDGHPTLEYLIEAGFEWSFELEALPSEISFFLSSGVEESPLAALGYHAGRTAGLSDVKRRNLLNRAYKEAIPWVDSASYMEEWGDPGTRKRLWRIAHHLARLARNRRSNYSMQYAVDDWANDLDWLAESFYRPWMAFEWPSVRIY